MAQVKSKHDSDQPGKRSAQPARLARSIDGISPAPMAAGKTPRNVYLARARPLDMPYRMISLRPRVKQRSEIRTASPSSKPLQPSPASRHQAVATQPNIRSLQDMRDSDIVIKLPRHRVIYARLLSIVQYGVFAIVALVAAGNSTLGQYFVLAYALYAILRRSNSQRTFLLALLLLISVPIFQILGQTGIADNMAIYTYELLVIGTVQAIIELKWPGRQKA